MALPIEQYGIIGDTHTAALVGSNGSIDWLCLPHFDSEACFASLLGEPSNGCWQIAPTAEYTVTRRYRPDTLVLETVFETSTGAVRLVDCMPIRDVHPQVVRVVEAMSGTVDLRMDLVVRFGYGKVVPWVRRLNRLLVAVAGPDALALWTPVAVEGRDMTTVADFSVSAGEVVPFVLTWFPSHEEPPRPVDAEYVIAETTEWWEEWSATCSYDGPWRDAVMRSLVTLKALTYSPTGGIVAAATTSLPETVGGVRNWDYRYCWIRDASLTLAALMRGGYHEEAMDWRDWLLRAVAGEPSALQIMYGAAGERRLDEWEVDWLSGYEGSRPVRVGNAASGQFQLDVYGELMATLHQSCLSGDPMSSTAWDLQCMLVDFVTDHYDDPDDGIWEVRGPRRHFTHSKVMAWVALDRAVRMAAKYDLPAPVEHWKTVRDRIKAEVLDKGFDEGVGAFTQYYGSSDLDASLLMMPLFGFLPASDPRVVGTVEAIHENLTEDGFVLRYRAAEAHDVDGLQGGEGAFLACSFWMADCLHLIGRHDEACELFERLLELRNDLGLLSEEYDPRLGRLVGNFPQAFSHVSLANSAYNLSGHPSVEDLEPMDAGLVRMRRGRHGPGGGRLTGAGSRHSRSVRRQGTDPAGRRSKEPMRP